MDKTGTFSQEFNDVIDQLRLSVATIEMAALGLYVSDRS